MHEWSPYRHVHPPHLDGYLRSKRGEFRLVPLPNGRTRLEGRTWYELDLAPSGYFALWSHWAIHRIHARVLEHIARETSRRHAFTVQMRVERREAELHHTRVILHHHPAQHAQ